jgi:quinoprotein glucose dehydrogenase
VAAATICVLTLSAAHRLPEKAAAQSAIEKSATDNVDWPAYGGGPGGTHYSALRQITRENVSRLKVAWTFDTKEAGSLETSPVIIDGILYAFTPPER